MVILQFASAMETHMEDIQLVAAILTVAVNQRPDHQAVRSRNGNTYNTVVQDYVEVLGLLSTKYPATKPKPK